MAECSSVDEVAIENGEQQLDGLNVTSEIVKEDEENCLLWDSFLVDSIDRRAAKALNLPSVEELLPRRQLHASRRTLLNSSRPQSRTESLIGVIYSSMASDIRSAACSVSPSPNRLHSGRSSACASFPGCGTTAARKKTSTPRKGKTIETTQDGGGSIWSEALQQIGDMELLPHDDSLLSEPELDFEFHQNRKTMDILLAAGNLDKRRTAHGGYGTPSSYASEQEMNLYFDNSSSSELPLESLGPCHVPAEVGLQSITLLENKMKEEIIPLEVNESIDAREKKRATEQCRISCPAFKLDPNKNELKTESALTAAVLRCGDAVDRLEKLADSSSTFYNNREVWEPTSQTMDSSSSDIEDYSFQNESHKPRRRNSDSALNRKMTRKRKTKSKVPAKPENRLFEMIKSASESVIDRDKSKIMIYELTTPDILQIKTDGEDLSAFNSFQENLKELRSLEQIRKNPEPHFNQETSELPQSPKTDSSTEFAICQDQVNMTNLSDFDSFQERLKELRSFDDSEPKTETHLKDENESDFDSSQSYDLEEVKTSSTASSSTTPVYQEESVFVEISNTGLVQEENAIKSVVKVNCTEGHEYISDIPPTQMNNDRANGNTSSSENQETVEDKSLENSNHPIVSYFENDCCQEKIEEYKHIAMVTSSNGSSFVSKDAQESSNCNSESPIYFERDHDGDDNMLTARRNSIEEIAPAISLTNDFQIEKEDIPAETTEEESSYTLKFSTETNQTNLMNGIYYHTNKTLPDQTRQCPNPEELFPNNDLKSKKVFPSIKAIGIPPDNVTIAAHLKDPTSDIKYVDQAACDSGTESGYGTTNETKPKIKEDSVKYSPSKMTRRFSLSKNLPLAEAKKLVECRPTPLFSMASVKNLPHPKLCEKEINSQTSTSLKVNSENENGDKQSNDTNFDATKPGDPITLDSAAVNQELSLFDVKVSVLDSCLKTYEEFGNPRLSINAAQDVKSSFREVTTKQEEETVEKADKGAFTVVSQSSTQTCSNKPYENLSNEATDENDMCENNFKSSSVEKQLTFDAYGDPVLQTDFSKYSDYYSLSPPREKLALIESNSVKCTQARGEECNLSSQEIFQLSSKSESSLAERMVRNYSDVTDITKSSCLYIQPEVGTYIQHQDNTEECKTLSSCESVSEKRKQKDDILWRKISPNKTNENRANGQDEDFLDVMHQPKLADEVERELKATEKTLKRSTSALLLPTRIHSEHEPKSTYNNRQQAFHSQLLSTDASPTKQTNNSPFEFSSKYKNLEEQIERILNPTPSPPLELSNSTSILVSDYSDFEHIDDPSPKKKAERTQRKVRFDVTDDRKRSRSDENALQTFVRAPVKSLPPRTRQRTTHSRRNIFSKDLNSSKERSSFSFAAPEELSSSSSTMKLSDLKSHEIPVVDGHGSQEYGTIAETLRFVRENLNRDDYLVKKLEMGIQSTCRRMLEVEQRDLRESFSDNQNMSRDIRVENGRPTKVRALEEVVNLLKKHVQQREVEINGLGGQLRHSNEKILLLEKKLKEKQQDEHWMKGLRQDKENTLKKLQIMQAERDELKKRICSNQRQKEDAQKASRKAHRDLDLEKENYPTYSCNGIRDYSVPRNHKSVRHNDADEKADDLEYLNQSSSSDQDKREDRQSFKRENCSSQFNNDQSVLNLKSDNTIMREKLDRMNEISAENLVLQSDAADYQVELAELREEAKELRTRCYELNEENRQCKAEIRDLRRYIELLKSNKTGDSRQDLLNKIEYYQMEHDRLLDEVRRLKHRLGEVSPRSPRSPRSRPISPPRPRAGSPKSSCHASYPGISSRNTTQNVRFSHSLERGRSPVSDAMAASTASSHAAVRLVKDRSLSPAAALNIRDLTMDRYHQHMDGPDSPRSMDSDSTELLLKPQTNGNGYTSMPSTIAQLHSDDDDDDVELDLPTTRNGKLSDSNGSNHGRRRSPSKDSMGRSSCRRSCSPTNPGGFRSVSPRMTSTQKPVHDTARDRYPTKIKRSLPRRAFAPRSPADLMLGYSIKFTRPGGRLSRGTVKYIGHLPTRDEIFIGVELDGYDGKHSGTFQGTKYFTCPTNKGIFTPFSKVIMAWE